MRPSYILEFLLLLLYFLISTYLGVWGTVKYLILLVQIALSIYAYVKKSNLLALKVILFSAFLPGYIFQYIAIIFSILFYRRRIFSRLENENKAVKFLLVWGGISYLINQFLELNVLSFPFFFLSFFLPMLFFSIFFNVGRSYRVELMDFIKLISLFSFSMAFIQYYVFELRIDHVTGGLKDAHVLGFVACSLFMFTIIKIYYQGYNCIDKQDLLIGISSLPVAFLSDSKYIIVFMFFSVIIGIGLFVLNRWARISIFIILISLILFNSYHFFIPNEIALSERDSGSNSINTEQVSKLMSLSASGQLWIKTINLHSLEPWVFFFGAGPGTVTSRAANSRAFDTMEKVVSNYGVNANAKDVESKLPSFISAKTSWVTKKHIAYLFKTDWNGSLYDYRSSIISYIWEFGVIGLLILAFYLIKLTKRIRKLIFIEDTELKSLSVSYYVLIIFFFQCALVAYYFEYTHIQIFVYSIAGMFFYRR